MNKRYCIKFGQGSKEPSNNPFMKLTSYGREGYIYTTIRTDYKKWSTDDINVAYNDPWMQVLPSCVLWTIVEECNE